ncbi:MAG: S-layer homology domain-containing protein [Butyricicoccus sp.]
MTINKDVTVEQSGNFSSLVANGYYDYEGVTSKGEKSQYIEGTNAAEPTLTIKGGTFSGGINTLKNDDGGNITINGGTVTNYTQAALQNHNVATINGGTFTADSKYVIDDCGCNEAHDSGELMIFGGTFMGKLYVRSPYSKVTIMDGLFKGDVLKTGGTLSTIGGYYSTDVAKYCPIGWTTVANTDKDTKDAYPYTIGVIPEIDDNEVKADVATGATNSTVDTEKITTEDARNAATTVANTVATTKPIADKSELTENDKKNAVTALKNAGQVTVDADGTISKNVTVIMQTYLDVTATEYVIGDTDDTYRVTMDITPKYNLVAVATENNEAVDVAKGVAYLQGQYLMNAGKTEVTVTLPTQYANKKVYITHKDDVYIATADENGKITFTTNGFSPFTFTLSNPDVVAEVNGNAYKSLQNAIDAAQTGATIVLQKNCTEKVTVAGKSLTINRNGKTFNEANVTVGSNCTKEVKNDTIVVTYTKPSSGGSSGGSSSGKTTYKVTTSAVNNGGVNASPSNAEKGATITITLSPDKGYKLDKLTVTDGSGKTVSTVKKSDTVYTFTMPASAVKVGVSYVKATETPSETKFNDVSANDWFASAVDYVTGKGMMNGTADNTFSPKANTTRGMVVTVLYRLENQPSTSAASFTDVASGAYYANAVAWANANGIVSGYGSGKFGPNDKVTREQLAAILYRYAQYKKYDVSVGEDTNILSYNDAQSISSYAIPAIQWACGAGVVTGKSGSKLDPKGNATRAEVAAMLMRFCENVK